MTREVTMIVKFTITSEKDVMNKVIDELKETVMVSFNKNNATSNVKSEIIFQDDYRVADPNQIELFN